MQFSPLNSTTSFESGCVSGSYQPKQAGPVRVRKNRLKFKSAISWTALGLFTILLCLVGSWELNQYKKTARQISEPTHETLSKQDDSSASEKKSDLISRLFCPIIDLPAFQGMFIEGE